MKFVSRHPNYNLTILDQTQKAEVSPGGATRYVPNDPGFTASFDVRTLSIAEITAAKDQILINGGRYAFGSIPGSDEGNINIQDAADLGYSSTAHTGYDVYQNLSLFDTSDPSQCPPDLRELVEDFMLNHYELGFAFVRVDDYNLTPPWPTYPTKGDVNVEAVVAFAVQGGLVSAALSFEEATGQRPDMLVALQLAADAEQVKRDEEAGLTARV